MPWKWRNRRKVNHPLRRSMLDRRYPTRCSHSGRVPLEDARTVHKCWRKTSPNTMGRLSLGPLAKTAWISESEGAAHFLGTEGSEQQDVITQEIPLWGRFMH
jgi:hypothetical protein